MQNDSYSLSIVKKLTAGKHRWTLVRTDGEPTDVGVVLEDVEKLLWKKVRTAVISDLTRAMPMTIVTPDESTVVFAMTRRRHKVLSNRVLGFVAMSWAMSWGFVLGDLLGLSEELTLAGSVLLGLFCNFAVYLRKTLYDVTDESRAHIGVISTGVSAKFIIETSTGRWTLTKVSKQPAAGVRFALLDENNAKVGHVRGRGVSGFRDIKIQDSRLDARVAAAAGFFTTSLFQSNNKYHQSGRLGVSRAWLYDFHEYRPGDAIEYDDLR